MKYEDFIVQIGPDRGDGYTVSVLSSPAGEGEGLLRLPYSAQQQGQVFRDLARSLGQTREAQVAADGRELDEGNPAADEMPRTAPEEIGGELFRALFSGQVLSLFDQSLGILRATPDRGLRIKLKLNPRQPELAQLTSLPWEYLHRPETDDYLGLSRTNPFVRYLDVPRPSRPPPLPEVLRILLVISSPLGHRQLDLVQEWREIEAVFQNQPSVDISLLPQASPTALRRELLAQPIHVLHFMGHGGFEERNGEGVLYFEGPERRAEPVSGRTLATELNDCGDLRLVLLNACNTARATGTEGLNPFAGVATALVLGGLPAVVAMQYPISDPAAIAFSQTFYQRLAAGDPVDAAVVEGRLAIRRVDPRSMEWGTPVLFMRSPDGHLFTPPVAPFSAVASHPPATVLPRAAVAPAPRRRRWTQVRRIVAALIVLVGLGLGLWEILRFMPAGIIPLGELSGLSETSPGAEAATTDIIEAPETALDAEAAPTNASEAPETTLGAEAATGAAEPPETTLSAEGATAITEETSANPTASVAPPPDSEPESPPPSPASGARSIIDPVAGMRFRYVRAGSFMMGSPESEKLRDDPNEFPHPVTLTHSFWIGETEVTQEQWEKIIGANPSYFRDSEMASSPVEYINWYEALDFANQLSRQADLARCYALNGCEIPPQGGGPVCREVTFSGLDCTGYRIPTEAEWEIAARAGTTGPFHTGSTLSTNQANYHGAYPYPPDASPGEFASRTLDVMRYKPNPWHLYQMYGNVWEWTWDRFGPYPTHGVSNPTGPPESEQRVIRGGSFRSPAKDCRSAARGGVSPAKRSMQIGVRLVKTAQ